MNYNAMTLSVLASTILVIGGGSAIAQSTAPVGETRETPVGEMGSEADPLAPTTNQANTPEATATQLFTAMQQQSWNTYAQLMHPDALAEFHEFLGVVSQVDTSGEFANLFLGVKSPEEQAALSPTETFARFMQFALPLLNVTFDNATHEVLGSVTEEDIVHVMYRVSLGVTVEEQNPTSVNSSTIGVLSFKEYEGEWRSLLTADIQNMIQTFRQQIVPPAP